MYPPELIKRFWSKVAKCAHGDGCKECCWPWQGHLVKGYGVFSMPKAYRIGKSKEIRAGRLCLEIVTGEPLAPELHACHNCPQGDNPGCMNPAHLWKGTEIENHQDATRKGRRPRGDAHGLRKHPEVLHRGEDNHYAKLTVTKVQQSRLLRLAGWTHAAIAEHMQVSRRAIQALLSGESWAHLPWPDKEQCPMEQKEYAQMFPTLCPLCRSARCQKQGTSQEKHIIYHQFRCLECESTWEAQYALAEYGNLQVGAKASIVCHHNGASTK